MRLTTAMTVVAAAMAISGTARAQAAGVVDGTCQAVADPQLASLASIVDAASGLVQGGSGAVSACPSARAAAGGAKLGATIDPTGNFVDFQVYSKNASHLEVDLFDRAMGADAKARIPLTKDPSSDVWHARVALADLAKSGVKQPLMYGYRAWGANWSFDPSWTPGSHAGFVADVDAQGNRFDPNKLLLDPYATEVTQDPINPSSPDGRVFASGDGMRDLDDARLAPKGLVQRPRSNATGPAPTTAQKDDVIYEANLRGLTAGDPSIPANLRGTFAGAAMKAAYLKSLGITTLELQPVMETQNDQNDSDPAHANYWGYMTDGFFSPDRRFSSDKSAGGPTREFQDMVKAFHQAGIKVDMDVVYNHTGEGGIWGNDPSKANVLSWRGLDNQTYYEKAADPRYYFDNTGTGNQLNTANDVVRNMVVDSLDYWHRTMGVDGFRFDLAAVLGNETQQNGYTYDRGDACSALNRAVSEIGVRPPNGGSGVDLIAEPWDAGGHNLQGQYPQGWSEWNGRFRDTFRASQNQLGFASVTPGELATRFAGSSDLMGGRRPGNSINFIDAHDGFTLADLYRFNGKNNSNSAIGSSDGGADDNKSWNQGGDPALQRQAARNGMAFLMLSAGTPMFVAGDEYLRSTDGNNNPYNLDTAGNWLSWDPSKRDANFQRFTEGMIAFRQAHPALRPANFFDGRDHDGNGVKDITWYTDSGREADGGYMSNPDNHFLGYRIDGHEVPGESAGSIYVAYNGWSGDVSVQLPPNQPGMAWYRAVDTAAWDEANGNVAAAGQEARMTSSQYGMHGRTVTVFIEKPAPVASNP